MEPRNTRTVIVKSAFPAGTSHAGVADIIARSLEFYSGLSWGYYSNPFLDPQLKKTYEEAGSISSVIRWSVRLRLLLF